MSRALLVVVSVLALLLVAALELAGNVWRRLTDPSESKETR